MLGITTRDLLNEDMVLCAPFGAPFASTLEVSPTLCTRLAAIYPGEWHDKYFHEARQEMISIMRHT